MTVAIYMKTNLIIQNLWQLLFLLIVVENYYKRILSLWNLKPTNDFLLPPIYQCLTLKYFLNA